MCDTRIRVVTLNVNWNSDDREWNLNSNRLDDNYWNEDNRVFARSLFSIFGIAGAWLVFQAPFPTPNHFSYFI